MSLARATELPPARDERGGHARIEPEFAQAHPFAGFLRTIGRGATLGRPLDEEEAEAAMSMILDGEVEPVQLGAFLLVLRYRTETAAELAGFVRAARARIERPAGVEVDLDWPSYADRHKQLPYFVLAAVLLADNGIRVLMHGLEGEGPATTRATLGALGIAPARSSGEAADHLERSRFAYLPLEAICPQLERLFHLRPLLGLRSPANSLARELNPLAAAHQIQGVFHPTYLPLHQETALRLGQSRAVIFKGGGGEGQRNPDKPCRVVAVRGGEAEEMVWPALCEDPHPWRKEPLEPERLAALWQGEWQPAGPVAAVVGTAAMALWMLGRAPSLAAADALARRLWDARRTERYPRS